MTEILFSMVAGDDHQPEEAADGSVTEFGEGNIIDGDLYAEVAFGVRGVCLDHPFLFLWQPTAEQARHAALLLNRYADARGYDLDEELPELGEAS